MKNTSPLIDFHSHILPGVDHGSSGLTETRKQLQIISSAGVDIIVSTSHFYPNASSVDSFLQKVQTATERMQGADLPPLSIAIGAEVLYCHQLEKMDGLDRLCVRGTDVLLLEAPMDRWDTAFLDTVEALTKRFTVVLAHIDRYVRVQKEEIGQLLELGAFAQINGYAFSSLMTRGKLKPFIESDRVVALGSDLHGADAKAYDQFLAARKRLGDTFDRIMARSAKLLEQAEFLTPKA